MPTQIIAGRVNIDGTTAGGTGFYVRALGDGIFIVEFDSALPKVPSVVIKQNYKNWDGFDYGGGDTRDNAVLVAVDKKGFKVLTGQSDGSHVDRNFAFIAAVDSTQDDLAIVWGDIYTTAETYSPYPAPGFEATGIGDGVFLVDFDQPFDALSSVVVTQNYLNWNEFTFTSGKTTDNAVIVAAKNSQFKYITGDSAGNKVDRNCSFVAVGTRNAAGTRPRFAFGNVDANGVIRDSGSADFGIEKGPTGTYTIRFHQPFTNPPALLVTQNYKSWDDFKFSTGDTRDNAVLVAVDTVQALVITGQNDGSKVDRNFSFLAVG